jgi:hypothetical protein
MLPALLFAAAATAAAAGAAPAAREPIGQVHLALTGSSASEVAVTFRTAAAVTHPHVTLCAATGAAVGDCAIVAATSRTYKTYGLSSGHFHSAVLRSLRPAAVYNYSVGSAELNDTKRFSFVAPDPSVASARVIYTGDFGLGGAGPPIDGLATAAAWAAHAQAQDHPNTLCWVAGDIAYANMHGAFAFEKTWNAWFDALEPAFAAVPTMVSPGNHETYLPVVADATTTTGAAMPPSRFFSDHEVLEAGAAGAWNFTAFDHRFFMPGYSNPQQQQRGATSNMWYSFDLGGVHFVSINTESDFPKAAESFLDGWGDQLSWLKQDLERFSLRRRRAKELGDGEEGGGGGQWLVMLGHKPIYSAASGYHSPSGQPSGGSADLQASFEELMHTHKADLYLSGHQHGYERSHAIYRALNSSDAGTVHIVAAVPGGGCGITADWPTPIPAWSATRWPAGSPWNDHKNATEEKASLGYGILDANESALHWRFVLSGSGQLVDEVVLRPRQ